MIGQRIINNMLGNKPKADKKSKNKEYGKMTEDDWDELSKDIKEESYNPNSPWYYIRLDEEKNKQVKK